MKKERGIGAKLDAINKSLEKLNDTAHAALDAIPKPESKLIKVLKAFVLIAGALAVLNSAEIIRAWIKGG